MKIVLHFRCPGEEGVSANLVSISAILSPPSATDKEWTLTSATGATPTAGPVLRVSAVVVGSERVCGEGGRWVETGGRREGS